MKQVLHIFKKDIRHQRIDLVLYLGLLVVLVFVIPGGWLGNWSDNEVTPYLRTLAQVALPITWLVLITRLIHAESLVGDRQFWTTRPYRWSSLLLAKLLFVAVCVALPYLGCQLVLAIRGGAPPLHWEMLVGMGMHALIVWIPMLLIACVTRTLALTFFTTLATVIAWAASLTWLLDGQGPVADTPYSLPILATIYAVLFALVLARLYSERRILEGRVILAGLAVLLVILIFFVSKMSPGSIGTRLLETRYRSDSGYRLLYDPSMRPAVKDRSTRRLRSATLPVQLAGLPAEDRLDKTAVQFTLDMPGFHYASPWRPVFLSGDGLPLLLPASVVSRVGAANASLSLQVAADDLTPGETLTSDMKSHVAIPGGGVCVEINPPGEGRSPETAVVCRYAFGVPAPVEVMAHTNKGCSVPAFEPVFLSSRLAGTSADPLTNIPITSFFPHQGRSAETKDCTVQSLTATLYRTEKHFRASLTIPSIRLVDYIYR